MVIGKSLAPLTSELTGLVGSATAAPGSNSFSDLFKAALGNVDGLQSTADTKMGDLLQGAPNSDVGGTMVAVEKADVAFQLMMQVRNKAVSAYQDLEKMQF